MSRLLSLSGAVRPRLLLIVGIAAVALGFGMGGGVAFAYFTSGGSGTGHATAGTLAPVTIESATASPSAALIPGSTGDVVLDIDNTNTYAVTLVSVTGNGTITPDAGHSSCATTGVSFTNQTGLSTNLPGNHTTVVHLSGAASMNTSSSNGCQGATFFIPVTISVKK